MFPQTPAVISLALSGDVKPLAVTSRYRLPQLPDVPTLAEALLPGFHVASWNVVLAPKGLPDDIRTTLSDALVQAVKEPQLMDRMRTLGVEPVGMASAEADAFFLRAGARAQEACDRRRRHQARTLTAKAARHKLAVVFLIRTRRKREAGAMSIDALVRGACAAVVAVAFAQQSVAQTAVSPPIWTVPEIGALPDNAASRQIRRGRDLVTGTYAHIGPEVPDRSKRFAGNNLACGNCHLEAGTKKFGIALFGLFGEYPRYSARAGAEATIEDRLNSCMTRSMNGRPLPAGSPPMQAFVAYIKFLSTGVPPGKVLPGLGVGKMPELDRAADPVRGKSLYADTCVACHNTDGSGIRRSLPTTDLGYMMPPLWGADSFNDGAGMARLITAANFIHFNMPHGADYLNPQLKPEDAWDIAAYVISQPRPHKAGLDEDFPDRLDKPVDTPYGPYADGFSAEQHKYGPFAPIRAAVARLRSGIRDR